MLTILSCPVLSWACPVLSGPGPVLAALAANSGGWWVSVGKFEAGCPNGHGQILGCTRAALGGGGPSHLLFPWPLLQSGY